MNTENFTQTEKDISQAISYAGYKTVYINSEKNLNMTAYRIRLYGDKFNEKIYRSIREALKNKSGIERVGFEVNLNKNRTVIIVSHNSEMNIKAKDLENADYIEKIDASKLKHLKEHYDLKIKMIANATGYSNAHVSNCISGKKNMSFTSKLKMIKGIKTLIKRTGANK